MMAQDPHRRQPVRSVGKSLERARGAMVLIHGRGDTAAGILTLSRELYHPDFVYLAPQAAANTWYPYSFLAPIAHNEPGISSGIASVGRLVEQVVAAGISRERIMIGGFSQGACLAVEFVARNAARYGGVIGYSGGLIGPESTPRDYEGSLAGTPVFLGCSDVDFHIPKERVEETAAVLGRMGAEVTMRLYPGMGHTVNQEELDFGRQMLETVLS